MDQIYGESRDWFNQFINTYKDKESNSSIFSTNMYNALHNINFNNTSISTTLSGDALEILKKSLKNYVENYLEKNDIYDEKTDKLIKKNIDSYKWEHFKKYLNNFYPVRKNGINNNANKIIPKNNEEFRTIYSSLPIIDFVDYPVKKPNEIFQVFIKNNFEYMTAQIMISVIETKIKEEKNIISFKKRETRGVHVIEFSENKPLLRTFMASVHNCIHVMSSQPILTAPNKTFWKELEENIGKNISIEDESFTNKNSLFTYVKQQLIKEKKNKQNVSGGGRRGRGKHLNRAGGRVKEYEPGARARSGRAGGKTRVASCSTTSMEFMSVFQK